MPDIFKTDNPLEYTSLDGVIVTERQPPLGVVAAGANNCIFIGQFEKGPVNKPQLITSVSDLEKIFGNNYDYSGNRVFRLKGWSNVYVSRVVSSSSAAAKVTLTDGTNNIITLTAKEKGAYGNRIKYSISNKDATAGSFDITFSIEGDDTPAETYKGLTKASNFAEVFKDSEIIDSSADFGASKTVDFDDVDSDEESGSLSGGSDGSVTGSDYATAIKNSNLRLNGKIYFADSQDATVKAALSNLVKTERDGICVIGPDPSIDSVDDAIADAETYQDNEGRVLYAYNDVGYNIGGSVEYESPVALLASILNLSPPNQAPNSPQAATYANTAVGVKDVLTRGDLIKLKDGGIMAFENDPDLGVRIVSPVTGSPDVSVIRRRMSDFYISSIASFLKNFQGSPNSILTRASIRSAISSFDRGLVFDGILPSDAEIQQDIPDGKAFLVRTEGITTAEEKARGIVKVQVMRRLFSSARFLILIAEIGESVVVREEA